MEEQTFSPLDFLELVLFLGSLTYLLGLVYQIWTTFKQDKKINLKSVTLVVVTRLLTISTTFFVWLYWSTKIDVMFGFILLPAFIPEILFCPLLLRLWGYQLWHTKKINPTINL